MVVGTQSDEPQKLVLILGSLPVIVSAAFIQDKWKLVPTETEGDQPYKAFSLASEKFRREEVRQAHFELAQAKKEFFAESILEVERALQYKMTGIELYQCNRILEKRWQFILDEKRREIELQNSIALLIK
jgi:hypothetical protein